MGEIRDRLMDGEELCPVCYHFEGDSPSCKRDDCPNLDELQVLMKKLGTPDPEWQAFIDSLPAKYWAKYDLSALRLGWEAAKRRVKSE